MTTTTKKHQNFVTEPIGDKSVEEIPGIGFIPGGKLKEKGFSKANQLLDKYLTMEKNEFEDWLKKVAGVKKAGDCARALGKWYENFWNEDDANQRQATDSTKAMGESIKHSARMASTINKREKFVYGHIGDKRVTDLPGIGYALGGTLEEKGYDLAYKLLGIYLIMGKIDTEFQNWLQKETGADQKEATDCSEALKEWCKRYMD